MSSAKHAGRIMAITGGSAGIGQCIALRLASEGARVAVLDLADAGETIALANAAAKSAGGGLTGGAIKGYQCDISNWEQMSALGARIRSDLGEPQILVHCAALQLVKPFEELTVEQWRATQAVNLDGGFHLVKLFLPAMKSAGWGRIVMVASSSFFAPPPGMSHYIASKGALIGFVRGLAAELGGHGITVNALAPGLTRTKHAVASVPQSHFDFVVSRQAVKRGGEPEDQAGALSFLVSEDAGFMSGQTLLVDGGEGHL